MQRILIFLGIITFLIFCVKKIEIQEELDYNPIKCLDSKDVEMEKVKNKDEEKTDSNCLNTTDEPENENFSSFDNNNSNLSHTVPRTCQFESKSNKRKMSASVRENDDILLVNTVVKSKFDEKPENKKALKDDFLEKLFNKPVFQSDVLDLSINLCDKQVDEYIIDTERRYLNNIIYTIETYQSRIQHDKTLFFTNIKGKFNLKANLEILKLQVLKIFQENPHEELANQNSNCTMKELIKIFINEFKFIKEGNNINDLEKIFKCSEPIRVYGLKIEKIANKSQLQDILKNLDVKNIKEELKKYKKYPIFYEFMLFTHLFANDIVDQIEERYFFYVQFLFEVFFIKLENLSTKIKEFEKLTNDDLSKPYKNFSYKHKIGLKIQPLKIILIHICSGLKNGTFFFKRFITVYLLEFTYLFMTEKKMNFTLNDEFGCKIHPLYHYIYDDSLSLNSDLYPRIGYTLAILSQHNYHSSQDINLSFSKIIDHISKKKLLKNLETTLKNLYGEFIGLEANNTESLQEINRFLEYLHLFIQEIDNLTDQEITSSFNSCRLYIQVLRINLYRHY